MVIKCKHCGVKQSRHWNAQFCVDCASWDRRHYRDHNAAQKARAKAAREARSARAEPILSEKEIRYDKRSIN